MLVYGKERKFLLTVGASAEVAKACPGQKLANLAQLFGQASNDVESIEGTAALIVALNKGHEMARSFREPGYKPDPLTVDQVLTLDMATFRALAAEAGKALQPERTIETEPVKKKEDAGLTK